MTDQREQDELKTPFSFKLMVVLVVLYLGWRLVEVIGWLWDAIF